MRGMWRGGGNNKEKLEILTSVLPYHELFGEEAWICLFSRRDLSVA